MVFDLALGSRSGPCPFLDNGSFTVVQSAQAAGLDQLLTADDSTADRPCKGGKAGSQSSGPTAPSLMMGSAGGSDQGLGVEIMSAVSRDGAAPLRTQAFTSNKVAVTTSQIRLGVRSATRILKPARLERGGRDRCHGRQPMSVAFDCKGVSGSAPVYTATQAVSGRLEMVELCVGCCYRKDQCSCATHGIAMVPMESRLELGVTMMGQGRQAQNCSLSLSFGGNAAWTACDD